MASQPEYLGINAYLHLIQDRLTSDPDYVQLVVPLSRLHTYITVTDTSGLRSNLLRDEFIAAMEAANRMKSIIKADQPVRNADGAFRIEMLTLLGKQTIRETAANARAEAEAKAENGWFIVAAGGASLLIGTAFASLVIAVGVGLLGLALALGAVVVGPALAAGAAVMGLALAGGAVLGSALPLCAMVVGPDFASAAIVGLALAGGAVVLGQAFSLGATVVGPALAASAAIVNLALAAGAAVFNLALVIGTAAGGAALAAGALKLAGSSSVGPVSGFPAVTIQSILYEGAVVSGSLLALCQSAARRGIAVGNAAEIAAGVTVLGTGARLLGGMGTDGPDNSDDDEGGGGFGK
ncbi:hypothetical protein FRC01_002298 [Tulasnella sp. 417]|nr:hypothetical protein FRC01_002298 [Tulasnella sp. 417]